MILVISRLRVTKAEFNIYQLFPVAGVGMRGKMSGISIDVSGRLKYGYKKGWFKVSDSTGCSAEARNIHADLTLSVGKIKIVINLRSSRSRCSPAYNCSGIFKKIYRNTFVMRSFCNKIADFRSASLQNSECILDYILKFLRNISE